MPQTIAIQFAFKIDTTVKLSLSYFTHYLKNCFTIMNPDVKGRY